MSYEPFQGSHEGEGGSLGIVYALTSLIYMTKVMV